MRYSCAPCPRWDTAHRALHLQSLGFTTIAPHLAHRILVFMNIVKGLIWVFKSSSFSFSSLSPESNPTCSKNFLWLSFFSALSANISVHFTRLSLITRNILFCWRNSWEMFKRVYLWIHNAREHIQPSGKISSQSSILKTRRTYIWMFSTAPVSNSARYW